MKAIILAAGRGERARPLTDTTPKALLAVGGKPLICRHLENLAAAGITDVVVNVSWLGEQIEAYIGTGERWGCKVQWSREPEPLETAGGIRKALPLLVGGDGRGGGQRDGRGDGQSGGPRDGRSNGRRSGQRDGRHDDPGEPFAVINGDVWTDFPLARLLELDPGRGACLVMVANPPGHPAGDFVLGPRGRLLPRGYASNHASSHASNKSSGNASNKAPSKASNKSPGTSPDKTLTYAGLGVYSPAFFKGAAAGKLPLRPLLDNCMARGELTGIHYRGRWHDVGTIAALNALNAEISD